MAALAIWCGPHLEPNFTASAYRELSEACEMLRENSSKRSQGVRVSSRRGSLANANEQSLLPMLQALVHNRYPQLVGKNPATAKISTDGEDMLFALLGGQTDQSGLAPMQGNVMNPTMFSSQLNQPPPRVTAPLRSGMVPQLSQPPQASMRSSHPDDQHRQPYTKPTLLPGGHNLGPHGPGSTPTTAADQAANANYMQMPAYTNTIWQDQMLSLPLVAAHPNASSMEHFSLGFDQRQMGVDGNGGNGSGGGNGGDGTDQLDNGLGAYGMNTDDLWARLQTFYEPTPSYWGQSVGGVGLGGAGYVDYSGMAMGM